MKKNIERNSNKPVWKRLTRHYVRGTCKISVTIDIDAPPVMLLNTWKYVSCYCVLSCCVLSKH